MPKGKKKGKKGKKSKSAGGKSAKSEKSNVEVEKEDEDDIFMDKEMLLKEKLQSVKNEIEATSCDIVNLLKDKEVLERECDKVRTESEQFTEFLTERQKDKDTKIITLQSHYNYLIRNYADEGNDIIATFAIKKKELQKKLMIKQKIIAELREKVTEFDEYKETRDQQKKEIDDLEREIQSLRIQQSNEINELRSGLEHEFNEFQRCSSQKISDIKKAAYREALDDLKNVFGQVENENQFYRDQIMKIIKESKIFNGKKHKLKGENVHLKEQLKYAMDFSRYRHLRQEKPLQLERRRQQMLPDQDGSDGYEI